MMTILFCGSVEIPLEAFPGSPMMSGTPSPGITVIFPRLMLKRLDPNFVSMMMSSTVSPIILSLLLPAAMACLLLGLISSWFLAAKPSLQALSSLPSSRRRSSEEWLNVTLILGDDAWEIMRRVLDLSISTLVSETVLV